MGSSLVLNRRPKVPAEDTAAFGAIAERFRRAGALEQAVSLCRDGLKKFPDHVSARVTLGWSLLDLGKYDEARVELEQVMRRAPDNLAAIRGLAELHDRFEHTLNLPMDGPGQWPPPAESVDGDDVPDAASMHQSADATLETADAAMSAQFDAELQALSEPGFTAADMAPAAMGLPLWTPEPAASPVAEAAPAPVATSGTGMSSVREIDAFAGAPVPDVAAQVATPPDEFEDDAPVVAIAVHAGVTEEIDVTADLTPPVMEELGVPQGLSTDLSSESSPDLSNDALAALIAEAESLDAAAALEVVAPPDALELGSVELELADLSTVEPIAESVVQSTLESLEPAAELESAVELEPTVELQSAFELESPIELESAVELEPAVELEAVTQFEPAVELEAVAEFESAVELEPAAQLEPAAELEAVAELEPAVEIEAAIDTEALSEFEVAPNVAAQVAEVIAFASRPAAMGESLDEEGIATDAVAAPSESAAKVVALERMLRRVQSRRRELMAESVA